MEKGYDNKSKRNAEDIQHPVAEIKLPGWERDLQQLIRQSKHSAPSKDPHPGPVPPSPEKGQRASEDEIKRNVREAPQLMFRPRKPVAPEPVPHRMA